MFSDCRVMMIDSSANGSVSGSESRIVIGCSHDSNCAARIRYMNTSDSAKASRKFCAARAELARSAGEPRAVARAHAPATPPRWVIAAIAGVCETPGSRPANTVTCRWRLSRLISDGAVPGVNRAMLSSGTLPSRLDGTVSWPMAVGRLPICLARARTCTSYCSPPSLYVVT